jgi:hypothetical protein
VWSAPPCAGRFVVLGPPMWPALCGAFVAVSSWKRPAPSAWAPQYPCRLCGRSPARRTFVRRRTSVWRHSIGPLATVVRCPVASPPVPATDAVPHGRPGLDRTIRCATPSTPNGSGPCAGARTATPPRRRPGPSRSCTSRGRALVPRSTTARCVVAGITPGVADMTGSGAPWRV